MRASMAFVCVDSSGFAKIGIRICALVVCIVECLRWISGCSLSLLVNMLPNVICLSTVWM